jgi:hypothetical protein
VPGDLVKLSLGAVVAADIKITDGSVLVDQSMRLESPFRSNLARGKKHTPVP